MCISLHIPFSLVSISHDLIYPVGCQCPIRANRPRIFRKFKTGNPILFGGFRKFQCQTPTNTPRCYTHVVGAHLHIALMTRGRGRGGEGGRYRERDVAHVRGDQRGTQTLLSTTMPSRRADSVVSAQCSECECSEGWAQGSLLRCLS